MEKFIKEDRMHIDFPVKNKDKDFEWWYFDAHLDNGDHFVVMYSTNDTRLKPRQPSVRLNIYEESGGSIWELKEYEEKDISVSYDKCDVKMGDEYCIDKGEYYELYTYINGNGALLKFYPEKPHWTRPATKNVMGWTVAIPTGRVEGHLIKNNVKIEVKGSGYHDHNWGSNPMSAMFKNWYWGKVHTEEYTIDYGLMIPNLGNKPLLAMLVIDKDGAVFEPTEKSMLFQTKAKLNSIFFEEELGVDVPKQLVMSAKNKKIAINLTVNLDRIVMIEKSEFSTGESAYRYIGDEELIITRNGEKKVYNTKSLHEIVYLLK